MSRFTFVLVASTVAALVGCANTQPALFAKTTPVNGSAIPARIEFPSVQAILPEQVAATPLSTDVNVCVDGDGRTQSVTLLRSSGSPDFDGAVVNDVTDWRYVPPAQLACQQTTVTYLR